MPKKLKLTIKKILNGKLRRIGDATTIAQPNNSSTNNSSILHFCVGGRFVKFLNSPNVVLDKLFVTKSVFVELFLCFLYYNKVISTNFANF